LIEKADARLYRTVNGMEEPMESALTEMNSIGVNISRGLKARVMEVVMKMGEMSGSKVKLSIETDGKVFEVRVYAWRRLQPTYNGAKNNHSCFVFEALYI